MTAGAMRIAWYRIRATWRSRLPGYLALVVLTGVLGGVALAAVTAARRTDSSYPRFLTSTRPSSLVVQPFTSPADSPAFVRQLSQLPHVRHAAYAVAFSAVTLTPRGTPGTILLSQAQLIASPDGLYSRQDQVTIVAGRPADPRDPGQIVVSPDAAARLHLLVGSRLRVVLISSAGGQARARLTLTVTGIGVFNLQVLQDDIDTGRTGFLLGTPALAARYGGCCASAMIVGLRLADASRYGTAAAREYGRLIAASPDIPAGQRELQDYLTGPIEAEAQRGIRPEAVALGVFGLIAGAAALLIGAQTISRLFYAGRPDAAVLRALGAGPAAAVADQLAWASGAAAAGSLLAAGAAAALSPFSLFGPVRQVEPGRDIYLDWTVLGAGTAALAGLLGGWVLITAYRRAPHRAATASAAGRASGAARAVAGAGLPAPVLAGTRFALEAGRGRTAVPVRSVIAGAMLAACVGGATLTFGASLSTLIASPDLYGWSFSYALYSVQGWGTVPVRWAGPLLARDRDVAAVSDAWFTTLQIGGQTVPALLEPDRAAVAPHLVTGHLPDGPHQVVLGEATLAQLHRRVGETVTINDPLHARLRIVGTAVLPTIGTVLSVHPSMSTGALLSAAILPGTGAGGPFAGPLAGPNAIFVRLRPGVSQAAGLRSMRGVLAALDRDEHAPRVLAHTNGEALVDTVSLLPPQRPAEIVNYKTMGAMPATLAAGLAAGAVAGLAVTLTASVRHRRRDLALLKTLGFTRGQLAAAIAWQATLITAIGLLTGLPIGIAAGRWLWLAFTRELSAVPDPVVPALSLLAAALAALVLANLVAAGPGRYAARTRAAEILRAE